MIGLHHGKELRTDSGMSVRPDRRIGQPIPRLGAGILDTPVGSVGSCSSERSGVQLFQTEQLLAEPLKAKDRDRVSCFRQDDAGVGAPQIERRVRSTTARATWVRSSFYQQK